MTQDEMFTMDRAKLLSALREKLDACYEAYMADMTSKSPQVVFENAEAIYFNQQAYEMLTSDDCLDTAVLELLLQTDDPLRLARDEWSFWHDTILADEMDNASEFAQSLESYFKQNGQLGQDEPDEGADLAEQEQQLL